MRRDTFLLLVAGLILSVPVHADSPEALYGRTCIACHGANGKGAVPGVPDLTSAKGPLAVKSNAELVKSVLNGLQSPRSPIAMPPKGGNPTLTDSDALALVEYMRERFRPAGQQ
jgi:cytochrome c5